MISIKKKALALLTILLVFASVTYSFAGGVFKLNISIVDESGSIITSKYETGDEIYIKVDYETPKKGDFNNAVEGEEDFYLKISSSGISKLAIVKASTIICVDDMCRMSDEIDIFSFKNNTAQLTYGYEGYIIFKAIVDSGSDFSIKATLTYGDGVYSESDSVEVDVKEPASTPKPTAKPTAKPTDKPQSTGAPATSAPNATNAPNSPQATDSNTGAQSPTTGGATYALSAVAALGLGAGILSKKRKQ